MTTNLQGKTALVTGAAQGMGLAFAQALAKAGAHVVLTDVLADAVAKEAANLKASGLRQGPEGAPNVVLIMLDDVGFGQDSCAGHRRVALTVRSAACALVLARSVSAGLHHGIRLARIR